jgi:hypothetical protein
MCFVQLWRVVWWSWVWQEQQWIGSWWWTWAWTSTRLCWSAHFLWNCWIVLLCTSCWWAWQTEHLELEKGTISFET